MSEELEMLPDEAVEGPVADEALPEHAEVEPEPVPDTNPVPSQITAIIRTVTPYLVGLILSLLTWVLTRVGLDVSVPPQVKDWLATTLPVVLGSGYYVFARWAEKRWPQIPWLGSTKHPSYSALVGEPFVWYKGGKFSPVFRDCLVELDRLTPDVPLVVVQGGYNTSVKASAQTHAKDAVDYSVRGLSKSQIDKAILIGRKLGLFISLRTTAQGFSADHLHAVPNGWGNYSLGRAGAEWQWQEYRAGRNGLRGQAADDGPREYVNRTWPGYLDSLKAPVRVVKKPWPRIAEDGKWGPQTIKMLQNWLNVPVDGDFGPVTVKALQTWLATQKQPVVIDGKWGPQTCKALQRRLKVTVDGKFGPKTVWSFQHWMNLHV